MFDMRFVEADVVSLLRIAKQRTNQITRQVLTNTVVQLPDRWIYVEICQYISRNFGDRLQLQFNSYLKLELAAPDLRD